MKNLTISKNLANHFESVLNPLSPASDQNQFSPNDIQTLSKD